LYLLPILKRYAALGLKVIFSEVQVPIYIQNIDTSSAAGQAELSGRIDYQAQVYGGLMQVALYNPNVIAFSTQDMTDRYSWVYNPAPYGNPRVGFPDMFDKGYLPKPAYYEVLNALKNWR
jgi:GH35 family endo-1,4-beta-xylanase